MISMYLKKNEQKQLQLQIIFQEVKVTIDFLEYARKYEKL